MAGCHSERHRQVLAFPRWIEIAPAEVAVGGEPVVEAAVMPRWKVLKLEPIEHGRRSEVDRFAHGTLQHFVWGGTGAEGLHRHRQWARFTDRETQMDLASSREFCCDEVAGEIPRHV